MSRSRSPGSRRALLRPLLALALAAAALSPGRALAQDCSSQNPADWPDADKPYFLFLVDTSGSMGACTSPEAAYCDGTNTGPDTCAAGAPVNACGWQPSRINDAKCALKQAVTAFSGEATFGLASFDAQVSGCGATRTCTTGAEATAGGTCGGTYVTSPTGCSTYTDDCSSGTSNGGRVLVPLVTSGGAASSATDLLKWVDGQCGDVGGRSQELFAYGGTPLAKSVDWMARYFSDTGADGFASPLRSTDRTCREVNLVILSDGDPDGCDAGSAKDEAKALFDGITRSFGRTYSIKTHVIGFGNEVDIGVLSEVAQMGQCGTTSPMVACPSPSFPGRRVGDVTAVGASNSAELAAAFATIISEAIRPEECNNGDDNCNGCVDEGYAHYQNLRADCCTRSRSACLLDYASNPIPANLPCVDETAGDNPSTWLCASPGEECDGEDDDGDGTVDEGFGSPVCCPTGAEICGNSVDEDCDGVIEYTCGGCTPLMSGEACNGVDDDCDTLVDEGVPTVACGSNAAPFGPACLGVRTCVSGAYGECSATGSAEVCNALDDDCDGVVNDGIAARSCAPAGATSYDNATSLCKSGQEVCGGTGWSGSCVGAVLPTTEICNGKDDDCDGQVDEGTLPGEGVACGVGGNGCSKGVQDCQGGKLVCSGGTQPKPESCNGVDDDCDGQVDEGVLTDAPSSTGCWSVTGTACAHDGLTWSPPPGATCSGLGSLVSPCRLGTLTCSAGGWVCQGGRAPSPELCNNVDDDCDGGFDESPTDPELGQACSTPVGECEPGVWGCTAGVLTCSGVLPEPEECDTLDNDCDGEPDDGLPVGAACAMSDYDAAVYPGDRTQGECIPGRLACDESTGEYDCQDGRGPAPEVCDGRDNDCDGLVDEAGPAPDGIDGSTDPLDATRTLGQGCGVTEGECQAGVLGCALGHVACLGGVGPQREVCDCADNDCDGDVDEDAEEGEPGVCSTGKTCVDAGDYCACAQACSRGEFPCPTGVDACAELPRSGTDDDGKYCMPADPCAGCANITARTADGGALCGPPGTLSAQGLPVPVCTCLGDRCGPPCQGVACAEPGTACVPSGDAAGTCQQQGNCHFFGCPFGQACSDKACVDNPCLPNPCSEEQACKPNLSFTEARCVGSCAGVDCPSDQSCKEGLCVPLPCDGSCPSGQACLSDGLGGEACGAARCTECSDGKLCDPAVGCVNDPCSGVVCPVEQACLAGECVEAERVTPEPPDDDDDPGEVELPTDGTGTGGGTATRGEGTGGDACEPQQVAESGCACSAAGGDRAPRGPLPLAWGGLLLLALAARRRGRATPPALARAEGGVR
jgi:hypothetical protein